jgi:hypothetical protein
MSFGPEVEQPENVNFGNLPYPDCSPAGKLPERRADSTFGVSVTWSSRGPGFRETYRKCNFAGDVF